MPTSAMSPEQVAYAAGHFRALADAGRLRMIAALDGGELTVAAAAAAAGLRRANASKHLQMLHRLGLVARRRTGPQVWYRLRDLDVETLCAIACGEGAASRADGGP